MPYSEDAVVTEYFARFAAPNGDEWLMVTTIVDDPRYLTQRYVTSSHFRREPEGGRWNPTRLRSRVMSARGLLWLPRAARRCGATGAHAQEPARARTAWHVRDGIYMIVGAGGNTTVQVGDDGVLVVDTKLATASDVLLDAIRQISDKPIRYVINTHWHADHVGSNELIAKAGSTIAGGNVSGAIADAGEGAAVIAHENVLVRMSGQDDAAAVRSVAHGHAVHAAEGLCTSTARPSRSCISRPRTRTATASCSFAAPTSSAPATCSRRRATP